jgi:hypothetical protein
MSPTVLAEIQRLQNATTETLRHRKPRLLRRLGHPKYPRTANTTQYFQVFSSMYNALQVKLNRLFSSDLLLTGAYTRAKGMSFQRSDDGGLDFYVNIHRNYARTDFDRKHTFVSSFVYDPPGLGSGG